MEIDGWGKSGQPIPGDTAYEAGDPRVKRAGYRRSSSLTISTLKKEVLHRDTQYDIQKCLK
jgi:hypothetical protein